MMRPATLPFRSILISMGLVLLSACTATSQQPACPDGTQNLPDCPPQAAIDDPSTQNGDAIYISCYNNMAGAKQQLHDHKGVVEASSMVLEVSLF